MTKNLGIVKCAGHKTEFLLITRGNTVADETVKPAAGVSLQLPVMSDSESGQIMEVDEDLRGEYPSPYLTSFKAIQEQASVYEKSAYLRQGAD